MNAFSRCLCVWILAYSASSTAALVQFNAFLDISYCPNFGPGVCLALSPITDVSIAVGDTVDYTVTFGGARLTMFDDDGDAEGFNPWLFNPVTLGFFTISNATVDFLGLVGTVINPLQIASETNGVLQLGPTIGLDFINTGESISIAGYHVRFDVNALPADPDTYQTVALLVGVDRLQVTNLAPEPAVPALLAVALGALALTRRRGIAARNRVGVTL
jgi:hypothetical protein